MKNNVFTSINEAKNRRTTQYLILQTLRCRASTLKSLKNQVRVKVNAIKKEDKNFCFVLPNIPDCAALNLKAVIDFWIKVGFIKEKARRKQKNKVILFITTQGLARFSFIVQNSNGVGLNLVARKLFPANKCR
ncbi:hypothetical protein HZB05_00260 [Candidatus Wolfebacteria bacterium]|nr:hypothetical protein [Candidatus Wolfebacteria bacterium]